MNSSIDFTDMYFGLYQVIKRISPFIATVPTRAPHPTFLGLHHSELALNKKMHLETWQMKEHKPQAMTGTKIEHTLFKAYTDG